LSQVATKNTFLGLQGPTIAAGLIFTALLPTM